MSFIRSRMKSVKNNSISFENFKKFCDWFSPSLTTLITVSSEWQSEAPILLHGFVSRKVAEQILGDKDVGTFLIRLSESRAGWLAISFNDTRRDSRVTDHCLMSVDDKGFTLFFSKGERIYFTLSELVFECRCELFPDFF